jgi:hypothetical protein
MDGRWGITFKSVKNALMKTGRVGLFLGVDEFEKTGSHPLQGKDMDMPSEVAG